MDTYSFLREFADSLFLVAMVVFYLIACTRPFWPSRKQANIDAAQIPFRNDTLAQTAGAGGGTGGAKQCNGTCATCKSAQFKLGGK